MLSSIPSRLSRAVAPRTPSQLLACPNRARVCQSQPANHIYASEQWLGGIRTKKTISRQPRPVKKKRKRTPAWLKVSSNKERKRLLKEFKELNKPEPPQLISEKFEKWNQDFIVVLLTVSIIAVSGYQLPEVRTWVDTNIFGIEEKISGDENGKTDKKELIAKMA